MLCDRCGAYMPDDAITCEACGTLLKRKPQPEPGVRGIRQGRSSKGAQTLPGSSRTEPGSDSVHADAARDVPRIYREDRRPERRRGVERFSEDAGRPQSKRGIPRVSESQVRKLRVRQEKVRPVKKHMINWMKVLAAMLLLVFISLAGVILYLTRMPAGQLVLARMGHDAPAPAYWRVGEEYMDKGQIDKAIEAFRIADEKDPNNVDGLLSLGDAMEAAGRIEEAQELYIHLYEEISEERPEAYRNQIRLLIAADRTPEAAALMKLAYEKTGLLSFKQQRDETLPNTPEADLAGGRYNQEKVVNLTSPQEYDILYLIGDGELPKDGIPYEEPLQLKEGKHRLRAVCISGDLVSDPLDVTYNVVMPSPDAPKAGLAPGTYERAQRVWLRYTGKDDKDVAMYYTIDGSIPDTNSPRYTGDPILLPGGRVTLRAIAVNKYGKISNTMEVGYKIQNVPIRAVYAQKDVFSGFTLFKTTQDAFVQANGEPSSQETVTVAKIDGDCRKLIYPWGHCIVAHMDSDWLVVEVYQTQSKFEAPRSTGIGSTESDIVGKFRDMGQPNDQNGDRGLYFDANDTGAITIVSPTQKVIRYTCSTVENRRWALVYELTNGVVTAITHRYEP